LPISNLFEQQLIALSIIEKKTNTQRILNLVESGLDLLIVQAYKLLNFSSFFTFGKDEVKALNFVSGMKAPDYGGLIHTIIKKGFILVEVMNISDLINLKYENEAKSKDDGAYYYSFNV